jgi:hypothetical protein
MALGTAASGPGGHILRLINSGDFNKYKFPDPLETFDFDKLTLKILTAARKHQTFQFFTKFLDKSIVQF